MNYDKEIIRILTEAGDKGLAVAKISRHVLNSCNTFFCAVDYEDVHSYVSQYLLRNSKNSASMFEKTKRGVYRLNLKSQQTQQLVLCFTDDIPEKDTQEKHEDTSLSLF